MTAAKATAPTSREAGRAQGLLSSGRNLCPKNTTAERQGREAEVGIA